MAPIETAGEPMALGLQGHENLSQETGNRDARVHELRGHGPTGRHVLIDAKNADHRTPSRWKFWMDRWVRKFAASMESRGLVDDDQRTLDDPAISRKGTAASRPIVLARRSQRADDRQRGARANHPERKAFESLERKMPTSRPAPKAAIDDETSSVFMVVRFSSVTHVLANLSRMK